MKSPEEKSSSHQSDDAYLTLVDPKTTKVRPDFQRLIPRQSKGELMALEESIKQEGCRDPLLVWKGDIVLDGHTRRELAIKHKKQVKVREVELPDEKAAIEFILKIQRERRNLTREALSYFRGTEYNAVKQQRGGSKPGRRPKGQSDPLTITARLLADKYAVSEKTIKRDAVFAGVVNKIVDEYGSPEVRRALLGADVKLTHGTARALVKMSAANRKKAVKVLIEQGELPRSKKERGATQRRKQTAETLVAGLTVKGEEHARSVVQQMARLLGMEVTEKAAGK